MEVNDPSQVTGLSEENTLQKSVNNNSTQTQKSIFFIILVLIIFILLALAAAYYLVNQQSPKNNFNKNDNGEISIKASQKSSPIATKTTELVKSNWFEYQHPQLRYQLQYSSGWSGGTEEIPVGVEQKYEDFAAFSPDYQISEGYPVLEKGAEFFVRAVDSDKQNIEQVINTDTLVSQIARNKRNIVVDEQQAVQYDFSYEMQTATMTEFLKNGIHYTIKYRYPDEVGKNNYWSKYSELLQSFKAP